MVRFAVPSYKFAPLRVQGLRLLEYVAIRKLQEQSGSYIIALPKSWIRAQGLKQSDPLTLHFDDKIVIEAQPVGSGKKAKH
jgi:hypothetical protein